jgi:uncharacterized membrane protein
MVARQDTQLAQLRDENARCRDEARAAQDELAAAQADRVQLTRRLGEASVVAQALTGKLETARQETIDARMALEQLATLTLAAFDREDCQSGAACMLSRAGCHPRSRRGSGRPIPRARR